MKLRNKKTGEIAKFVGYVKTGDDRMFFRFEDDTGSYKKEYNSLAELNEEWEDAPEEPKDFYYINENGGVCKYVPSDSDGEDLTYMSYQKQIGNYFETKEEAEQAVEKLKAWKRLKDRGFRFDKVSGCWIEFSIKSFDSEEECEQAHKDLDLLFGGEE